MNRSLEYTQAHPDEDFAETFAQAYSGRQWIDKERARLNKAIEDADEAGAAFIAFFTTFGTLLGYYLCRLNRGGVVRWTRIVPAVVVIAVLTFI